MKPSARLWQPRHVREARRGRLKILLKQGWTQIGSFWLSPYSNLRYTEEAALDVESLRGTFKRERRRLTAA